MLRLLTVLALLNFLATSGYAEDPAPPQASPPPSQPSPPTKNVKKKGKASRDKETEGTEAADRFQADTVIKSRYQLNGEPLEVDPD